MSALSEYLKAEAPKIKQEVNARLDKVERFRKEVDVLLSDIHNWLQEVDSDSRVLKIEFGWIGVYEFGYGSYPVRKLSISLGDRSVEIVPKARNVMARLKLESDERLHRASGRVDMTDGNFEYFIYLIEDANPPGWYVAEGTVGEARQFDREYFERALLSLIK